MPNWLASELCMVASFALGAWKTFKVLKHGGTDYNLLKTWCLLGLLRAFEEYFEFLVSWIPFYWLGKCLGLGLLYLPGGNIPTVVFERVVVWGMDNAHHVLNSLVVPNVVEFAVSLPWRVLLVLFPSMPPPPLSSSSNRGGGTAATKNAGRRGAIPKRRGKGLGSQLQHLSVRTKSTAGPIHEASRRGDGRAEAGGAPAARQAPPPLPPRSPPRTPTSSLAVTRLAARNYGGGEREGEREGVVADAAAGESEASILVAQLLGEGADGGKGRDVASASGDAADGEGTSPESGGSAGGGGGGGDGTQGGRRPAPRRRSFGEMVRSVVTGSSQVRLRDHLFDLNTASPAPPAAGDSSSTGDRAADPEHQQETLPQEQQGEEVVPPTSEEPDPKRGPASRLPAIVCPQDDGSDVNDTGSRGEKRAGKKRMSEAAAKGLPPAAAASSPPPPLMRSRYPTRRRPSESSEPVAEGNVGGGGGDEAGGGGGGDDGEHGGSGSTIGGVGVRRRAGVGAGDRGGAGARTGSRSGAGRRSLVENKGSSSSLSSSAPGASKASAARGGGGSSATTRSSARRGVSAKAIAAPRGSAVAGGADAGDGADGGGGRGDGAPSTAAFIADSRAKRLAEWRKKRADRTREEQAERMNRRRYEGGGGGGGGDVPGAGTRPARSALHEGRATTRYRSGSGDGGGDGGGMKSSHASVRGGGVGVIPTESGPSSTQPPALSSRRFRHVERFRADMATGGHG